MNGVQCVEKHSICPVDTNKGIRFPTNVSFTIQSKILLEIQVSKNKQNEIGCGLGWGLQIGITGHNDFQ